MCALFRKTNPIEARRRRIERELELVETDLRSLSGVMDDPSRVDSVKLKSDIEKPVSKVTRTDKPPLPKASHHSSERDETEFFSGYLSGDFQSIGPLKNERKLQRNKAVVMIIFAFFILLWLARKFF